MVHLCFSTNYFCLGGDHFFSEIQIVLKTTYIVLMVSRMVLV